MVGTSARALISVDELLATLSGRSVPVILDVRWLVGQPSQHNQYLSGHIPGAQWCDLDTDLAAAPGPGGRHPLPEPAVLQAAVRRWGINPGRGVVVYDSGPSLAAARAWWVLRWAGLPDVRVLDGGFAAWLAADGPVQTEVEVPEPGRLVIRPGAIPSLDAAAAAEWGRQGRLLDVRASERFTGASEPIDPVAGHIPGARNLPTTENLGVDGRFLDQAELAARFRAALGDATEAVGVYCGSGVTAAHTVLALHEAGLSGVLYPGSWSEWITDPGRPIATGE